MERISSFLSAEDTQAAITSLYKSANLTIYAGAGVTIDKTGMSWKAITRELLQGFFSNEESVEEILKLGGDAYVASLADGMYTASKGEKTLNSKPEALISNLQRALYERPEWRRGNLTESLAGVISSRKKRGLSTTIITTNYDVFLEEAIRDEDIELNDDGIFVEGSVKIEVKHLHGMVPRSNVGSPKYPVVISEHDYVNTRNSTHTEISTSLNNSDILFIGSSLQDAPLVEALLNNNESCYKRWALVGRPTRGSLSEVVNANVNRAAKNRFISFGITPLTYDYYFEVSQFLIELGRYNPKVQGEYFSDRMLKWCDSKGNLADNSEAQKELHETLQKEVKSLHRTALREQAVKASHFSLRIETWLVFPENFIKYPLVLWASSDAIWDHEIATRNRPIEKSDHDYAVSRAFRDARTCLVEVEETDQRSRWRTHIGVPIQNSIEELPVGVIVLSITEPLTTIQHERDAFIWSVKNSFQAIIEKELPFFTDVSGFDYNEGLV